MFQKVSCGLYDHYRTDSNSYDKFSRSFPQVRAEQGPLCSSKHFRSPILYLHNDSPNSNARASREASAFPFAETDFTRKANSPSAITSRNVGVLRSTIVGAEVTGDQDEMLLQKQ